MDDEKYAEMMEFEYIMLRRMYPDYDEILESGDEI